MNANQEEVYANTAKPLLDGVLSGFNATVFAYGVSLAPKESSVLTTRPLGAARHTRSAARKRIPVLSFAQ